MTRQKDQIFVFTDDDFALAKSMWGENDDSLFLLRKAFLQLPLELGELEYLKALITPKLWALLKKRLHPDLDPDVPLTEIGDIYQTLTNDLATKNVDEMAPLFAAKQIELEYLDQQFEFLKDVLAPYKPKIVLEDLKVLKNKNPFQQFVDTTARNYLLAHIGKMLSFLKIIAGQKVESIEETKDRLKRDSAK
jgi:hypothetical protein